MHKTSRTLASFLLAVLLLANSAWPWGNEGHTMINAVAAEKLPADVPSFLRHAHEQMAYLGPEPDRWRETTELPLKASQEPDHFIDLELLEGMTLPPDRYSFYRALEAKRRQAPDHADNLWPERVGLQPYITMEIFGRLMVAFREYRHAIRDHRNTEFVERNAIFYAGWIGHYVADAANPLHTTVNFNGWITSNPNGYTTEKTIHRKMEDIFVAANLKQLSFGEMVPDRARKLENPFQDYLAYLHQSHEYVPRVYEFEKAGGFDGAGSPQSREFIERRMAAGAEMLRNLWYTAWINSAVDPPAKSEVPARTPSSAPPPNMKTVPKFGGTGEQPG